VTSSAGNAGPVDAVRAAGAITVEVYSWVNRLVGGDGRGCVAVEEAALPGDTVGSVLRRVGARFPELAAALWARGPDEIAEYLVVMVNRRSLRGSPTLDAALRPGDTIGLLGQFSGG
jgi:molybdopterin converting factor small subunit